MKALGRTSLAGALAIAITLLGLPFGPTTAQAATIDVLTITPSPSDEGQEVTLHGEFTGQVSTVVVAWGVGSGLANTTVGLAGGASSFDITKIYPDDRPTNTPTNTYTVVVTVIDSSGLSTTATRQHTVRNVAPTVSLDATPDTINEGESVEVTLTIADPGNTTSETFTASLDWGDGTAPWTQPTFSTQRVYTLSHTYATDDTFTITATATDDDTGVGTATLDFVVAPVNTPPSALNVTVDAEVTEGELVMLSGSYTDPDTDDTHTIVVNWGDQSTPSQQILPPGAADAFSFGHVYTSVNTYVITVTVTDAAGAVVSATRSITVLSGNSAPTDLVLTTTGARLFELGRLTATFTDADADDTHVVTVNWGDETSNTYDLAAGVHELAATHRYFATGTYTVSVSVADPSGATVSGNATLVVRMWTLWELIEELKRLISSWHLDSGTEQSLLSKTDNAKNALEDGGDVCSAVNSLANHTSAQAGKKLTTGQVNALWALLERTWAVAECDDELGATPASTSQRGSRLN